MKRSMRRAGSNVLSLDSLIDVFMNILGILIISAIAISLSPQTEPSPSNSKSNIANLNKATKNKPKIATIYLPSQETVSTIPLYMYVDSEGVRPIDMVDSQYLSKYFSIIYDGGSRRLTPVRGSVLVKDDLTGLLRNISGLDRHIVMLVKPDGIKHYKGIRALASDLGIRSGWTSFTESQIIIGPGGQSMNVVQ